MRQIPLLMVCSLVAACASVPKPDTDLCVVNAPGHKRKCYNIKRDYTDDGFLKGDAKPVYKVTATLDDLNKNMCIDPAGLEALKVYIKTLREEYGKCRSGH